MPDQRDFQSFSCVWPRNWVISAVELVEMLGSIFNYVYYLAHCVFWQHEVLTGLILFEIIKYFMNKKNPDSKDAVEQGWFKSEDKYSFHSFLSGDSTGLSLDGQIFSQGMI